MSNNTDTQALAVLPLAVQTRAAAISTEQAQALVPAVEAMWPKDMAANPTLARAVARVALAYGLDPLTGELLPLGGKIYITFEGRLRKAMEHEQFRGLECRPATEEERAAFRCAETDHLWRAEIYRADWPKPVVGWGRVTTNDSNPVARQHPQNVAEKRAKARALRDAFSIPLPNAEEADDYEPAPQRWINPETGAVTDTRPGGMLAAGGQIAAIHAICKELGIEEADRHDDLMGMFAKGATNQLTEGEAAAYLERLGNLAAEREAARPENVAARARERAYPVEDRAASPRFRTPQPAPTPEERREAARMRVARRAEELGAGEIVAGEFVPYADSVPDPEPDSETMPPVDSDDEPDDTEPAAWAEGWLAAIAAAPAGPLRGKGDIIQRVISKLEDAGVERNAVAPLVTKLQAGMGGGAPMGKLTIWDVIDNRLLSALDAVEGSEMVMLVRIAEGA